MPFPQAPLISTFTQADDPAGPPAGFVGYAGAWGPLAVAGDMAVSGNQAINNAQYSGMGWPTPLPGGSWMDMAYTIATPHTDVSTFVSIEVYLLDKLPSVTNPRGYSMYVDYSGIYAFRLDGSFTSTSLGLSYPHAQITAGNRYGFRWTGRHIEIWCALGGAPWARVGAVPDTTYAGRDMYGLVFINDDGGGLAMRIDDLYLGFDPDPAQPMPAPFAGAVLRAPIAAAARQAPMSTAPMKAVTR